MVESNQSLKSPQHNRNSSLNIIQQILMIYGRELFLFFVKAAKKRYIVLFHCNEESNFDENDYYFEYVHASESVTKMFVEN